MQSYGGNATYMMQVDSAFEGFGCFSPLIFSFSSFRNIYTCFYVVYNFPEYIHSHLPRFFWGNVKFGKCLAFKLQAIQIKWCRARLLVALMLLLLLLSLFVFLCLRLCVAVVCKRLSAEGWIVHISNMMLSAGAGTFEVLEVVTPSSKSASCSACALQG